MRERERQTEHEVGAGCELESQDITMIRGKQRQGGSTAQFVVLRGQARTSTAVLMTWDLTRIGSHTPISFMSAISPESPSMPHVMLPPEACFACGSRETRSQAGGGRGRIARTKRKKDKKVLGGGQETAGVRTRLRPLLQDTVQRQKCNQAARASFCFQHVREGR